MRSRYLATDIFFNNKELSDHGLSHLHLAVPDINHSDLCPSFPNSSVFEHVLSVPVLLELDPFPIKGALSDFYSDVIPRAIDDTSCRSGADNVSVSEEVEESICQDYVDVEGADSFGDYKVQKTTHKVFEFEIPELEFPLRGFMTVSDGILVNIPIMSSVELEDEIPYPHQIVKLIYSLENISQRLSKARDFSFGEAAAKFPLFEISEITSDHDMNLSNKEAFDLLLPQLQNVDAYEKEDIILNSDDTILSRKVSNLENLSGPSFVNYDVGVKSASLISILEMDLINLKDTLLFEKTSAIYPLILDKHSFQKPFTLQYQEVHILDLPVSHSFEMFGAQKKGEEMSDPIFSEYMAPSRELYETIVSSELAFADVTFKALPTPIICLDKEKVSSSIFFEAILDYLNPNPMSACDGIYLDWHLLLEKMCSREICYTCMNTLMAVTSYDITHQLQYCGQTACGIDISFWDNDPVGSQKLQFNESPMQLSYISKVTSLVDNTMPTIGEDGRHGNENKDKSEMINSQKVSSFFQSMSQHNDLNFFVNVRRGASTSESKDTNMEKTGDKALPSSLKVSVQNFSSDVNFSKWNVETCYVKLADHTVQLIDAIYKCFLDILRHDPDVAHRTCQFPANHDLKLLELSKEKLKQLIAENSVNEPILASNGNIKMEFIALYAVRQLTYLLCFFGIHPAYTYLRNLAQYSEHMTIMLKPIVSLLEDAHGRVEKKFMESHPSLSIVEEILIANSCHQGKKALIVADRVFWMALRQKLSSVKITFHEVAQSDVPSAHCNLSEYSAFENSISDALIHSNSLLIAYEQIFESFPFNKLDIILEYGGSYVSSRVSTICTKIITLPRIYFLNTRLDDYSIQKALCEDFDISPDHYFKLGVSQSMGTMKDDIILEKIEDLLSFIPLEEKSIYPSSSESEKKLDAYIDKELSSSIPDPATAKITDSSFSYFPKTLVIFNTQATEKEMLMSCRRSYQKVLSLEKCGLQVVERDIGLPLDIIFSASICLVWYNDKTIISNKNYANENSCISRTMEIIATDILMALSFAFKSILLVFEGESNFLATAMDSSDTLYAAAASLGTNLQLFCSFSSESTDEIILSCIKHMTRLCGGILPTMLETETLAESFLVRFPSINPLSANAILSSGGALVEFLEWSNDHRIKAIEKYHVPDESISLFSKLCRYGELGESKSGMTDCSSIDSDINSNKLQTQNGRKKLRLVAETVGLQVDDLAYTEMPNIVNNATVNPSRGFQPNWSRHCFNFLEEEEECKNKFTTDSIDFNAQIGDLNKVEDFDNKSVDLNYTPDKNFFYDPDDMSSASRRETFPYGDSMPGLDTTGCFVFSPSTGVHNGRDVCSSPLGQRKFIKNNYNCSFSSFERDLLHMKRKGGFSTENLIREDMANVLGLSRQGNATETFGENLFSKAMRSYRFHKESKCKNGLHGNFKENRTPRASFERNTSLYSSDSSGRNNKISKILSPSLIDTFRFQGDTQSRLSTRKNQNKQCGRQMKLKEEKKDSTIIIPSWTPLDKRARQKLSFTRNGEEKQSKLAWRNMNIPGTEQNFKKR